jgi:hypothetical protein
MSKQAIKSHRYELVHADDADFVAYQQDAGDGRWQTVSTWMIPGGPAGRAAHSPR